MNNKNLPRGIRNNNPLNIRHSASKWQGARVEQTDSAFVQFESMVMGYRAAWRVLETYWKYFRDRRLPFSVRNIIRRWAPPTENDSEAYIRTVCVLSGLGGNELLPHPSKVRIGAQKHGCVPRQSIDPLLRLVTAMACVECGLRPEQVDRQDVLEGWRRAFGERKTER